MEKGDLSMPSCTPASPSIARGQTRCTRTRHWLVTVAALPGLLGPAVAQVQPEAGSPPASPAGEVVYLPPEETPRLPAGPKRYQAPKGFDGQEWGTPRAQFDRLPEQAASVNAAFTLGLISPFEVVTCPYIASSPGWPGGGGYGAYRCKPGDWQRGGRGKGSGFHVLSEYMIEGQGFKFSQTGVLMHPVVYDFCAHWDEGSVKKPVVPENVDSRNRFCGMRLLFETESWSQLRELPEDHVTQYDLVLAELISLYGKPAGFAWRGNVYVEPLGDAIDNSTRKQRKFKTFRWCPAPFLGLEAHCDASIVLTLDPELGRGIVLFVTPALWQYAYAREDGPSQPDSLFTLIHDLSPKKKSRIPKTRVSSLPSPTATGNKIVASHVPDAGG
jgi:hypothetical protein